MNPHANSPGSSLSDTDKRFLDSILLAFDENWETSRLLSGQQPLPPAGSSLRRMALVELIKIDLNRQWQQGNHVNVEAYYSAYPELGSPDTAPIDVIFAEYEARQRFDQVPPLSGFMKRFPNRVEEIRQQFKRTLHGESASNGPRTVDNQSGDRALGPGDTLGDYVLKDQLGEGGMGQVFRAFHRPMNRTVALKVIRDSMLQSPTAVRRFQREIRMSAKLTHDNLVRAYDAGEHSGLVYLVMELLDGQNLQDMVAVNGPLPAAQALDIIRQAAIGLAYVHKQGLIHRDIKPGNLFLEPSGRIKILDLGLVANNEPVITAGYDNPLTECGRVLGTIGYMAPEQALNANTVDPRADIYGLGCTLFFLMTRKPPYSGRTLAEVLVAHREAPIPELPCPPELSRPLNRIVQRMLAKAPEDRFKHMEDVIAAFDRLPHTGATTSLMSPSNPDSTVAYSASETRSQSARVRWGHLVLAGLGLVTVLVLIIGLMFVLNAPDNDASLKTYRVAKQTETSKDKVPIKKPIEFTPFPVTMPLKEQKERVLKELAELNPGFEIRRAKFETPGDDLVLNLTARDNQPNLHDLRPVNRMPQLTGLDFEGSSVSDLNQLRLPKLGVLNCSDTHVSDLGPLATFTRLSVLELRNTTVTDLTPIAKLRLSRLDCNGSDVADLTPLENMDSLELLDCRETPVTSLKVVEKLPNLDWLGAEQRVAKQAPFLKTHPKLKGKVNY